MPYAQGDLPEEAFKTAIGSLLFFGGPEEDIADRCLCVCGVACFSLSCRRSLWRRAEVEVRVQGVELRVTGLGWLRAEEEEEEEEFFNH